MLLLLKLHNWFIEQLKECFWEEEAARGIASREKHTNSNSMLLP